MTDEAVLSLIKAALFEVAPNRTSDFENISLEHSIEQLQLDSVTTMEMVGYLEDQAETTFPDEELAKVSAIKDLAALVRGQTVGAA